MLVDYTKIRKQKIWDGIIGAIHHSERATMAHITIESGVDLPTHHHHNEQWSHVIEGSFEFTINDEKILLTAGMSMYIPSNVPHSGKALEKCKIIDCFVPPREEWKELPFIE